LKSKRGKLKNKCHNHQFTAFTLLGQCEKKSKKKKKKKKGVESQIKSNYKSHPPTCNELTFHINYLILSALKKIKPRPWDCVIHLMLSLFFSFFAYANCFGAYC
jgi:hypothetical protein